MTRRGAIIELAIVTAGVLIALSFDTVREWRSNRAMADEARTNLLAEIRANKSAIDGVLTVAEENRKVYRGLYRRVRQTIAGKAEATDESFNLNVRLANLSDAAYTTAETIGAFRYMPYQDARDFASLYGQQRKYAAMQDAAATNVSVVTGSMMFTDFEDAVPAQLDEWRRNLEQVVTQLDVRTGAAAQLSKSYAAFLERFPVE
jgi:hypothetical protein